MVLRDCAKFIYNMASAKRNGAATFFELIWTSLNGKVIFYKLKIG